MLKDAAEKIESENEDAPKDQDRGKDDRKIIEKFEFLDPHPHY